MIPGQPRGLIGGDGARYNNEGSRRAAGNALKVRGLAD